jgi:hypothetical protein
LKFTRGYMNEHSGTCTPQPQFRAADWPTY